ncbi:EF hand family protein [Ichthyophthirius multifiliis]|uniref:EF hand family protein n=1 Tax=Ichthyophthirius multifiliis TaxID=5932 RepID=G0QY05_ICHMU|nr:EF hand family protein [Ichthyophthirius multifiliis]EGR29905.1 EF hand family protein [Ichthyophthirius multifiliis]|eukprot:XP_004031141.1 EF hand family protein [Ichthyophthirius multifiliis]
MSLYGVGLNTNLQRINIEFRLYLSKYNGKLNIRNLIRLFQQLDVHNVHRLNLELIQKGLNQFGFFLPKVDYQCLLKYYDRNNEGLINYYELVDGIRERINERRLSLIEQLFDYVDSEKSGAICPKKLGEKLDVSKNKDFQLEKKTRDQIVYEFLSCFNLNENGLITKQEFISFYEDLSQGITSDQYFLTLLEQNWGLFEKDEQEISKEEVKSLVKALRFKLIQMTQGTNDEFLLRKLFKEFDNNKSGYLTLEDLQAMLIKLEIPIQKRYLQALLQKFDVNKSGFIEFEEFVVYLVNDPYP